MQEDAATSYLIALDGISDGHLRLTNQPHVTIHTAVIGEVQLGLFLARRIVGIVAIVGLDGNETSVAGLHTFGRKVDGDGQITTEMFLYQPAVHIDPLLTHDGLEVDGNRLTRHILRNDKRLPVPAHPLVIAASAGLGGFQAVDVRGADDLPLRIVEAFCLGTFRVTQHEAPTFVEVIHDATAALKGEETGYRLCGSSEE